MPRTQIEFDQANDNEFASQTELNVVKENTNTGLFDPVTMNNYDLWLRQQNISGRANDGNMIFFDPSGKAFVQFGYASYTDVAYYIFRGTNAWTPQSFKAICARSASSGTSYIRMLDIGTGLTVATITYTATAQAIRTTSTITNLPATESMFALQCYNTGTGKTTLYAASLYPTP